MRERERVIERHWERDGVEVGLLSADEGALAFCCLHTRKQRDREKRHTLKDTHKQ